MRTKLCLLFLAFVCASLPAALASPDLSQVTTIFVGKVRLTTKYKDSAEGGLWRAEIDVECVVRAKAPLQAFATVYYSPRGYEYAPTIAEGMRALFFCRSSKPGEDQPEHLWIPDAAHLIRAQDGLTLTPKSTDR